MSNLFNRNQRRPKLTLVGAGIGDPELITVKGLRALREADVVLYDALVDESLLDFAAPGAARIYVGKRRAKKAFSQEEINELIVDYARLFGHVVRLKGGDPFVFGRGLEEMQAAQSHGIEAEYIPGISSAVAAPGAAGIAVTLRGASRGFWVLTATTDTGELNPEIVLAARTDSTLVVLMGLHKLAQIAAIFKANGKENLPIAIIQDATQATQKVVRGDMNDIEQKSAEAGMGSPSVLVIGEVVRHQIQFALPIHAISSI